MVCAPEGGDAMPDILIRGLDAEALQRLKSRLMALCVA